MRLHNLSEEYISHKDIIALLQKAVEADYKCVILSSFNYKMVAGAQLVSQLGAIAVSPMKWNGVTISLRQMYGYNLTPWMHSERDLLPHCKPILATRLPICRSCGKEVHVICRRCMVCNVCGEVVDSAMLRGPDPDAVDIFDVDSGDEWERQALKCSDCGCEMEYYEPYYRIITPKELGWLAIRNPNPDNSPVEARRILRDRITRILGPMDQPSFSYLGAPGSEKPAEFM